jgi:hypothetical protein
VVENAAKWNYCRLSQAKLQQPIVADQVGYLYNKDAMIEYLLERSKYEHGPAYVKNLKDVKELRLVQNPGQSALTNAEETLNKSQWICPITGLEMNGMYKFFLVYTCGCVISERAIKSMQQQATASENTSKCLKCDTVYNKNTDLIVLNANDEDYKANQEKYNLRRESKAAVNAAKIKSKASNGDAEAVDTSKPNRKRAHTHESTSSAEPGKVDPKKNKSIQNDPNATDVFKSLFNTCDKAKNQTKAHWVTFNPQYF